MAAETVSIERDEVAPLMRRRDAPGLLRFGIQLVLALGLGTATVVLAAAGSPVWVGAVVAFGVVLATLFPPLHEAGHGTAFETPALNDAVVWICALSMLQVPSFFRAFHFEHHRTTQDPQRDPEIASAPRLLDDWPSNLAVYLLNATGQSLMAGKAAFTLSCALMPRSTWRRFFPFIKNREVGRIVWESRAAVLGIGAILWIGLTSVPGFAQLLIGWPIAHLVLGLYLMAEHTGLPNDGSQLERTRTVASNAVVRWWMWNMPYHAEHHAYPGVPFHAVPALHELLVDDLPHRTSGYLAFHREALRRAQSGA